MEATWRLYDPGPLTGAENMCLDEVLLEERGLGRGADTLRFLQFKPACVLVGFHQCLGEELRLGYCREQGIDVNRRVTGGGGLLFDEPQLGWELVCSKAFFNAGIPDKALYGRLCAPVVKALRRLGLNAAFRGRNDIEVNGRKICGTGGTDSGPAFMFQGTILTDFDVETMLKCLKVPLEKLKDKEIASVRQRVTCLKEELGSLPPLAEVKEAVAEAFAGDFGIRFVPGGLTAGEEAMLAERLPWFRSDAWIDGVRPDWERTGAVSAMRKTPFGLVRVTLQANLPRQRLKSVFITGDFLAYPGRALSDLESILAGRRLDAEELSGAVEAFFAEGRIAIPDMGPQDIVKPLRQALEKLEAARFGLPADMLGRVSTVCGSFAEIRKARPGALLLPYCAKLQECEFRYRKDCAECGACSVGEAWRMGREAGLETSCIVNFEDLMAELARLKAKGTPAFIGLCCQPFLSKHGDDFARAGLPGILADIESSTCYDLGKSEEAHLGTFEGKTELDLGLLEAVLAAALGEAKP